MKRPETKYVAVGDANVAYQILGEGPIDLLYFFGLGSNLEYIWEYQPAADGLRQLSSLGRLIFFDRRGTGCSDAVPHAAIPTWEEWAEDIGAVLDAVGSERSAIYGQVDAGALAVLYAALHPDRVTGLVLHNTTARFMGADDYQFGATPETVQDFVEFVQQNWGTPEFLLGTTPSLAEDPERLSFRTRLYRTSVTPRTAAAQYDYILRSVDVRTALPLIQAPTLVLHSVEAPILPIEHGRYLADHIEGAKLIEVQGDMAVSTDDPELNNLILEFLTGERPFVEANRVLTTVLFTDIVGSTERAATLGDQRWHVLLDSHDHLVREQIDRFRGKEVKTIGDGFLISFDGPARAIRCSQAIVGSARELGMDLRMGLHTGECEVRGNDLGGIAVHIAARVSASAGPGEILVSNTIKDLVVGSGIEFEDRGEYELKGVPGTWRLYAVAD
jgi:class 3 adenylate cyclase/alpha-beta hydrolase superfamily lysophospholipase